MPVNVVAAPGALRCWLGLAGFYVASFATLAIYMQFFPGWLRAHGSLSEGEVSLVLSAQTLARTVAGPFWAHRVDRRGSGRPVLVVLACASVGAFALFGASPALLAAWTAALLFGTCYSPMFPIVDAVAMKAAGEQGFSFGRLRMVGSLAFLLVILAIGPVLDACGVGIVFPILLGAMVVMAASSWGLPRDAVTPAPAVAPGAPAAAAPWWQLLRSRQFVWLLVAAAAIQGSHATYYNLSTVHWVDHGVSKSVAGVVWAEGVLAEIVLFFVARATVDRLRPTTLLMLGGACAMVRWVIVGTTTSVPVLLASAWLHAASFGCTYLGSLRALERRVPPHQRATAQGLLGAATSGVGMVVCGVCGGLVYDRFEGLAFLTMAAFAGLGTGLAFWLRRKADSSKPPAINPASPSPA
ncbi:MAG: MFS transporter [Planctomycetota bacterium]